MTYRFVPVDHVRPGDVVRGLGEVTANVSTASILNTLWGEHGAVLLLQAHDRVEVLQCL